MRGVGNDMSSKKNISRRVLQNLALLSLLTASSAWAQVTSDWDWDLEKVSLPNGCTLVLQSFNPPAIVLRHEGACKNGLADGDWVYGQKMVLEKDRSLMLDVITVVKAINGYVHDGLQLQMTDKLIAIRVGDRKLNGSRFDVRFDASKQTITLAELSKQIDAAIAVSQSFSLPTPSAQLLKTVAGQWVSSRPQLAARWLAPNVAANSPAMGRLQDDPKVFGRSARGG